MATAHREVGATTTYLSEDKSETHVNDNSLLIAIIIIV